MHVQPPALVDLGACAINSHTIVLQSSMVYIYTMQEPPLGLSFPSKCGPWDSYEKRQNDISYCYAQEQEGSSSLFSITQHSEN